MTEEIAKTDAYARSTEAVVRRSAPGAVLLDRTVFYARGGGQPGDTGMLRWPDGAVRVADTLRTQEGLIHVIEGESPPLGGAITAEIDWDRRYRLMRTHTALH